MGIGGGFLEEWCTMVLAMWSLLFLLPNNLVISEMYLKIAVLGAGRGWTAQDRALVLGALNFLILLPEYFGLSWMLGS